MRRTNFSSTTGFIFCFLMVLIGIATNGGLGAIMTLIHIPSIIVTLGGAFFAVMTTTDSFSDLLDALKAFFGAFRKCPYSIDDISQQIFEMSGIARKEGLLALEEHAEGLDYDLLQKGVRLVVDGTDPELVRSILETDMLHREERNQKRIVFWEDLGSYAPAWGMVGTLLGLINMMRNMGDNADAIGSGMSLALLTTLYGSIIANWLCIPVARRMRKNGSQESQVMELVIEGVLSIQAGENPQIIKEKIRTFREAWEERQEEIKQAG